MKPTVSGAAYACVNFPYAEAGKISLNTSGSLPQGASILLSDSYLDRATFLPENRNGAYAEHLKNIYAELTAEAAGEWNIEWNEANLTLTANGRTQTVSLGPWGRGFNHLSILFEGEGAQLGVSSFRMKGMGGGMKTGIEY